MSQQQQPQLDFDEVSVGSLEQKYSVIAELGLGGMSVVYLATSRSLGNVHKLVVLKSIKPELLSNDNVRNMFMDEARLAIRLTHPNIVQTYEVALIDRRPVLVMEYMEGQPLSNVLRECHANGRMPLAMRLHILLGALNGLDHAHNLTGYDGRPLGLVHRDVSPQNIFITYDGHVKILDFGIAKALDRSAQTEFGEIKGKIRYMAPEQMQSAVDLDRRADVFAMGVMLWELLANRRMWQDAKDVEVMRVVISQQMPSPREHAPELAPELEAICMKAIRRDPAERYESCAAMHADIERAMVSLGLRPSERALAKLLQEQFAEVRTKIRSAIDRRLKEGDTGPINLRVDERGLLVSDLFTPRSRRGDMSGTPSAVGVPEQALAKKSRWWLGVLVLLLLGGTAFAAVVRPQYFRELVAPLVTASAALPAVESARPAPAPAAASAVVHVNLRSSPAAAKLFLDGLELPSNPFVQNLPNDSARHELSAEAPGYEKKSKLLFLSGTDPVDVEIVLEKTSKPKLAAKPIAARPSRKPANSAPAAAAAPDCSYPFYVDAAGIRRVRHECM